jgi:hypothetical protein
LFDKSRSLFLKNHALGCSIDLANSSRAIFLFSEKRTRELRAHREGIGDAREMIWEFIFTRAKINKNLV